MVLKRSGQCCSTCFPRSPPATRRSRRRLRGPSIGPTSSASRRASCAPRSWAPTGGRSSCSSLARGARSPSAAPA
eukprot:1612627-Alexandrium_andersonii.AAC.1